MTVENIKDRLLTKIQNIELMLAKKVKFTWLFYDEKDQRRDRAKRVDLLSKKLCAKFLQLTKEMRHVINNAEIKSVSLCEGYLDNIMQSDRRSGQLVKVRPCGKKYKNKTFLGLYLGDMALGVNCLHKDENKTLELSPSGHNPAIFMFGPNELTYGISSWWGVINSEDDLEDISDLDIESVWYVKALRQIQETEDE